MTLTGGRENNQEIVDQKLDSPIDTTFGDDQVDKIEKNCENLVIECNGKTTYGTCNQYLLSNYFIIDKKCHWVTLNSKEIYWKRAKKSMSTNKSSSNDSQQQGLSRSK